MLSLQAVTGSSDADPPTPPPQQTHKIFSCPSLRDEPHLAHELGVVPHKTACVLTQGEHWDWSLPEHLKICGGLKEAVRQLHGEGVVHGDIHDGNILVNGSSIWLVDFEAAIVGATPKECQREAGKVKSLVRTTFPFFLNLEVGMSYSPATDVGGSLGLGM
jgi:serine/threonine protein kinase